LEESGFLTWEGDIPIYYLLGDKLWKDVDSQNSHGNKPVMHAEPLYVAHVDANEIEVKFFTLVTRLGQVKDSYSGGVEAFLLKHGGKYNEDICVQYAMAERDLNGIMEDIMNFGFRKTVDFVVEEIIMGYRSVPGLGIMLKSGAPWLALRLDEKGTWVRYLTVPPANPS
jgi:hypothetical protein